MPDLLGKSSDWLQAQRHTHLSETVEYHRGPLGQSIQATVGRGEFELADAGGVLLRQESIDFLVRTEDLGFVVPEAGDRIVRGGLAYIVTSFGGSPAWRFSDPGRKTLRIHTKLSGEDRG